MTGKLAQPRYLVLGIDPGIASCGFALLDTANEEILEMGTRLFDSPVVPKTQQSKAAVRRGFRSIRRNLDRTQNRLRHCLRLLKSNGIVPSDATAEFFHTKKGDKPPLKLRVEGIDRVLEDREWALVLYSLCKRRGYIPHGEGGVGDVDGASEDGKVLKALGENRRIFAESGCRTVGEWLATLNRSRNRGGDYDKCVTHAQLVDEAKVLFEAQRSHGSQHASKELEASYLEVFDWERPRDAFDKRTYELVGNCVYFPSEKRAARCTLTNELVSAYGALGNVTVVKASGERRALSPAERDLCVGTLFSTSPIKGNKECKVTFANLRKQLDLDARDSFKGIPFDDEKNREVYKPMGWRTLRKALYPEGENLLESLRANRDLADAVMEAVAYSSSAEVLEAKLSELELSDSDIALLERLPYSNRSLNGYGTRSKKALDLLLDSFDDSETLTLTDAERASGLEELRLRGTKHIEPSDRLIPYSSWLALTGGTNNNPVVLRSMAQMRKVVNAICREWGVPDEIHVELSRDLALPKKAKDSIAKANRKNEKENERIRKQISELTGRDPEKIKGSLVAKWRLWEEQDELDIYTGDSIDEMRLINDDTYTQVDHALPFSRTGDNSRHNKVLVLARSNQLKRERSPFEWMTSREAGAPAWDEFVARVQENHKLSPRKRSFLLERDLTAKEGDFQSRNLTDTAYMAREVCAYLSDCLAFPEDGLKAHVVPTKGTASAWLRRAWGLNFGKMGEKDRSDDRHHATDACVIAACSRSLVIQTAKLSEHHYLLNEEGRSEALANALPWPSFADDVRAKRETVIPTRFVPRVGSGQLFEQTIYSYAGTDAKGKDLLKAKDGVPKPAGNAVVSEDGKSAIKVGGMICLRLWHDPEARKGRGQWYADPIYYADLPALRDGTYVPRIAKAHSGRKTWKPIPEAVLKSTPIELYLGDAVQVGEYVGRLAGFDINSANWSFVNLLTKDDMPFPTIGKLDNYIVPHLIREDILGKCWHHR